MQSLQANNNFTAQGASEQKSRRERKSKSPKQRREKREDNGEQKKEKVPKERRPQEPWKQSRRVFNDMLKVQAFIEA